MESARRCTVAVLIFALCASTSLIAVAQDAALPDKGVVAIVNGEPIRRDELTDVLMKLHGDDVLRQLINTKLLEQYARKNGIPVVSENDPDLKQTIAQEVDDVLASVAQSRGFRTLEELQREMDKVTPDNYQRLRAYHANRVVYFILPRLQAAHILGRRITIADKDIRERYDLMCGAKAIALQIVVLTNAKAAEITNRLQGGADFAVTAMEQSVDTVSRRRGGVMDPLPDRGVLGKAAFELKPGGVSGIIRTEEGYHILKLERKIPARKIAYDDVKEQIKEQLLREEVSKQTPELLLEIRGKSTVSVGM